MKTTNFFLALAFIGLSSANAQVGFGTTNPDASAALDVESTTKGFLPPRMTETERDSISSPATGLTIYNTDINCLEYYGGFGWTSLCAAVGEDEVINSQTGRIWMDRNLGASQVATSPTDTNAYGDLYQWGRAADGHEDRSSTTYTAVQNDTVGVASFEPGLGNPWDGQFIVRSGVGTENWVDDTFTDGAGNGVDDLWQGDGGVNDPCPSGYKVPTQAEWENERASWGGNNASGAYNSIKLVGSGGFRPGNNGSLADLDAASYWSSTIDGTNARRIRFMSTFTGQVVGVRRSNANSIRCIKVQD